MRDCPGHCHHRHRVFEAVVNRQEYASSGIVHFAWPRNLLRDLKTTQCRGGIHDILFKCDTIAADQVIESQELSDRLEILFRQSSGWGFIARMPAGEAGELNTEHVLHSEKTTILLL